MHHLFSRLRREQAISCLGTQCQALVRFFALRRIKPHTPPLVRAPVNSFEFQPCGRTPQAGARTTGVSNPVRSPGFRISASDTVQKGAFATGVPPNIYAFHRYTGNSPFLSCTQAHQYPAPYGVEPRIFTPDLIGRLHALYAQ